jgi:uncharacterized protein YgiM (DUF1202 family)
MKLNHRHRLLVIAVLIALLTGLMPSSVAVLASDYEQRAQFQPPVLIVNTSFLNVRSGPGIQYGIIATLVGGTGMPVLGVASDRVWYQVSTVAGVGWVNVQLTIPRGDFRNVPLVEAPPLVDAFALAPAFSYSGAVNNLDDTAVDMGFSNQREWGVSVLIPHPLRAEPTINAAEVQFQEPDNSVIYTVLQATFNEGVNWIRVSVPSQFRAGQTVTGWLEETKVRFRPFACQLSAVELTQSVDLRRGPDGTGANGDVSVAGGYEAYLLDRIGNVYKIELINGSFGWVEESFIRVRDRASVRSEYCELGGAAARIPSTAPGQPGQRIAPSYATAAVPRVIINTGFLNIRSGPGAQFTTVATLPGGTELPVIGRAADGVWYLVRGPFGDGWLNVEFTLFRGDGSRLPIIRNATGMIATPTGVINRTVTLYAAPNLTLGVVGTVAGPVEVDVVARTADGLWVQVNTALGFGWVQAEFISLGGNVAAIPVIP